MKVRVRSATPLDARRFLEVHHAAVRGPADGVYPAELIGDWAPLCITEDAVAAFRANPDGELRLVAEAQGEMVGVGALAPGRGELVACYVAPQAARRGVGARIVRALERIARREGVAALTLSASLNSEIFYRALGYRPVGPACHVLASGRSMACIAMRRDLRRRARGARGG